MTINDTEIFEFKGNALIHFRVQLSATTIYVSTHKKYGDAAVRTWTLPFSAISKVHVHERIGQRNRSSGVYLTPSSGSLVMFSWLKSALGASKADGETYYRAAAATLCAIAQHQPDMRVLVGPALRTSYFVGAALGLALGLYILVRSNGALTSDLFLPTAFVLGCSLYAVATSGVLSKRRQIDVAEAAELLAQRATEP